MLNGLSLFSGIGGLDVALSGWVRPMKTCEYCKKELLRKRKPSGKLEANSSFSLRRFCNSKCRGDFTTSKNECLESSVRQRTLKLYPKEGLEKCSICDDSEMKLQRHHIDKNPYNNLPENILICCQNCHAKEHQKNGVWGKGKKQRICISCNQIFVHKNRRRKTCSSGCFINICASKAMQRWACG
jgi:hypothetical protein